jgi:hypothetical protein
MKINTELSLRGLSIISGAITPGPDQLTIITCIAMGSHDEVLFETAKLNAKDEADAIVRLENIKANFKHQLQILMDYAFKEDHQERKAAKAVVLEELKANQQPHELGTVAEISAKYGISKSEVRRRKADGTLHELVK